MFTRAIVRPPSSNFAEGLTSSGLGAPNYRRALQQHEAYCAALERCGLELTRLEPDEQYPDSCFVEDVAVVIPPVTTSVSSGSTENHAVITRPGAPSRAGEIMHIRRALAALFPALSEINPPGTLDGGDVCEAGRHFFIGISERTNEAGAEQLAALLAPQGYTSSFVDIRGGIEKSVPGAVATGSNSPGILHLKSGLAYLGDDRLVITDSLADRTEFAGYDLIQVDAGEEYAANCVRVNDYVLIAAGFPRLQARLHDFKYQTIALEMSEFQKMDGGLSCLSLRF